MSYESILLDFSDSQLHSLVSGKAVNVKVEQVGTGHLVFLTRTQINKIHRNKAKLKGTRIKLSDAEAEYNQVHGNGRFTDFLKKGWTKVKEIAAPVVATFARKFGDKAVDTITNKANSYLDTGAVAANAYTPNFSFLPEAINKDLQGLYHDGTYLANNMAQSELSSLLKGLLNTVKGRGVLHELHGSGLFDDILGGVSSVVGSLAPVATNVMTGVLQNKLNRLFGGHGLVPPGMAR